MRTSKAIKGIIISIIIITIGGLVSSFWLSWAGIIPLVASVGGMIVFLGLWIEKEAEEEEIKPYLSNFVGDNRFAKLKSKVGWRILMAGIIIEVITAAGLAGIDQIKEVKNNPWNGTISDISADMYFEINSTNPEPAEILVDFAFPDADLFFDDKLPKLTDKSFSPKFSPLYADRITCAFPPITNEVRNLSYWAYFHSQSAGAFSQGLTNVPVKMISRVNFAWIDLRSDGVHFPENAKILNGAIDVKVNGTRGTVRRVFLIYPQIPFSTNGWKMIIATNAQTK
jgi:hypothetical protein